MQYGSILGWIFILYIHPETMLPAKSGSLPVKMRIMVLFPSSREQTRVRRSLALIFQIFPVYIKRPKPNGFGLFMELLARFELATRFHEIADFMDTL